MTSRIELFNLSCKEVLVDAAPSIRNHSIRHARLSVFIARELGLPRDQVELLRRVGWAHDIGGAAKTKHAEEHKKLLRLEFTRASDKCHGAKPSFNPAVCLAHAEERILQGLRGPLLPAELEEPFLLYKQEFELLNGGPLSDIESLVLQSWWYHPLFSVHELRRREIVVPADAEVVIRCNEQPWLFSTDDVRKIVQISELGERDLQRLIAIVRASDIIENGNNRMRRVDLRGVPVESFGETIAFLDYKFRLDGLSQYRSVILAVEESLFRRNEEMLEILFEARESHTLARGDLAYLEAFGAHHVRSRE